MIFSNLLLVAWLDLPWFSDFQENSLIVFFKFLLRKYIYDFLLHFAWNTTVIYNYASTIAKTYKYESSTGLK